MLPDIDKTGKVLNLPIRAMLERWFPRSTGASLDTKVLKRWTDIDAAVMDYFKKRKLPASARVYLSSSHFARPVSLTLVLLTENAGVQELCIVYLTRLRTYPHPARPGTVINSNVPKLLMISPKIVLPPFEF